MTWKKDEDASTFKNSKRGQLELMRSAHSGEYITINVNDRGKLSPEYEPMLETVYRNGRLVRDMKFHEVRENARIKNKVDKLKEEQVLLSRLKTLEIVREV